MNEFIIDNFLEESAICHYPEWLNLNSKCEKIYFDEIKKKFKRITRLIEQDNNSKLSTSLRKITASSLAKAANNKNRSSFNEKRYPELYGLMKDSNARLNLIWKCKVDNNKKKTSGLKKIELKDRVALLENEIKKLKSNADKSFIAEILEVRRKSRFADYKRTIDDKDKRIEELEMQNAELQLKLRDMLRPI